jgi:hypothetical protein
MATKRAISNAGSRKNVDSNSYSHNTSRNDRRVSKEDTAQNMVKTLVRIYMGLVLALAALAIIGNFLPVQNSLLL